MKAALFVGGWEGHSPTNFSDWCEALLRDEDFDVDVYTTLAPLADPTSLADIDLIVPIWSSARSSALRLWPLVWPLIRGRQSTSVCLLGSANVPDGRG